MIRLSLVQGDTAIYRMAVNGPDCNPVNLNDYEAFFTIKRSRMDANAFAIFLGSLTGGDIVPVDGDPALGLVDVIVPASASKLMRVGKGYYWDLVITKVGDYFTTCSGLIFAKGAANIHG